MQVTRHGCGFPGSRLDDEVVFVRELIDETASQTPSRVRTRAATVGDGAKLAGLLSIKDAKDRGIVDALRVTSRAGVALFAPLGAESDVEVEFWEGTKRMLPPLAPAKTGVGLWLRGLYGALALRDEYALAVFRGTDLGLTRQELDHLVTSGRAHQGYLRGDGDTANLVSNAILLNAPERVAAVLQDLVAAISRPTLVLLEELVAGNESGFNEQLESALVLHKKYWSTHSERRNDPTGMIALPLLALSCWAHDAGMTVEVTSDYIPRFIIENTAAAQPG